MGIGRSLFVPLIPWFARGVMNVQNFDYAATYAIENLVGIATERGYAHICMVRGTSHALRPSGDMRDDHRQAPLYGPAKSRIVLPSAKW